MPMAPTGLGRIYTLDPITGAATLVSTLPADLADTTAPTPFTTVSGTSFGAWTSTPLSIGCG